MGPGVGLAGVGLARGDLVAVIEMSEDGRRGNIPLCGSPYWSPWQQAGGW